MYRLSLGIIFYLAVSLHANDKKPPVGPVREGMAYEGVFRSGEPDKQGVLRKPNIAKFKLDIKFIDGEAFEGTWTWDGKDITKVEGKITRGGVMTLRFTENIKGKSVATFDGQAAGKVSDKQLQLRYVRPSGNRVGLAEGKIKLVETK